MIQGANDAAAAAAAADDDDDDAPAAAAAAAAAADVTMMMFFLCICIQRTGSTNCVTLSMQCMNIHVNTLF